MLKKVLFDYFGENDFLYFDIARLEELETACGKSLGQIAQSELSTGLLTTGLMIGLKHSYRNKNKSFFHQKIGEYLEQDGSLTVLWYAFIKAVMISGVFGKEIAEKIADMESFGDAEALASEPEAYEASKNV